MDSYKRLLADLVALKSISTDKRYKQDVKKTANWLVELLSSYGFDSKLLMGTKTNPYVYGSYVVDPKAETLLIYGHYDVQPAGIEDRWNSPPFELTEREGRLYARGVVDNKGQVLIHLYAIGKLIKEKKLKYNVKFFIEGDEETSNPEMAEVIKKYADLLMCDYVVLSDGEITNNRPTIDVSFRGGGNVTLTYQTAKNDLHSGIYGGAVPNAAHELSTLISKFYTKDNTVTFASFYDNVDEITEKKRKNNQDIGFDMNAFTKMTGVKQLKTESGNDFYTQKGLRPMFTVSGLKAGYTDEGYSNIVPHKAVAKINFRFVPSQDVKKALDEFKKFVAVNTPDYVKHTIDVDKSWGAVKIDIDNEKIKEASELLEEVYKEKVVYKFVGGSIPAVLDFKEVLGKETISISLGNEDCNMHGVDENFRVDLIEKGIEFSKRFFGK